MLKKVESIDQLVGDTPVVRLNRVVAEDSAAIWAKLESYNPGGSVKDRIGLSMIEQAEKQGALKQGDTIVEPTSGNTGIALALIAAQRGYKLVLTMPKAMSEERRKLLQAYGAELVLVKPEEGPGMTGAIKRAEKLSEEKGYFMPQQFKNQANPYIHEKTTGPEIVEAFEETGLDYFVAGIGTGGTITGASKVLKAHFPNIEIYAVEPTGSPILSGGEAGKHSIQGIGAGFVPEVLDTSVYDEVIKVSDEDAKLTAQRLAREEGILAGISSGAAVYAALKLGEEKGSEKQLLTILPDTGERYLSTNLYG